MQAVFLDRCGCDAIAIATERQLARARRERDQIQVVPASGGGFLHPIHVAVGALGQELAQAFRRLWNSIRPGDTDGVEALRARRSHQRRLERCRLAQKSRLA